MLDRDEVRKRIEKRYRERTALIVHLVLYFGGWLFFGFIWLLQRASGAPAQGLPELIWPLFPMGFWSIIVIAHVVGFYLDLDARAARRRAAIERQVDEEMVRQAGAEKPKRDQIARLADDGEIVLEDAPKRKTTHHEHEAQSRR